MIKVGKVNSGMEVGIFQCAVYCLAAVSLI